MRYSTRFGRHFGRPVAILLFACLGVVPSVRAQQHMIELPATSPLQTAQPTAQPNQLTLAECVRIGLERQPALAAQRATVGSAEAQRRALDNMICASLISREIGFRKQQAYLGVTIAQAGLEVAEHETVYAVTRCYYTVAYARKQEAVAKGLLEKLEVARKNAQAIVKKGDPDSVVTQVDVDKLSLNIDLVQLRLIEASTGIGRATAALKEAMGVQYDTALSLNFEDFPATGESPVREILVQMALSRRGELVQASSAVQLTELEVCAQNSCIFLPYMKTFAAASDIHSKQIPQGMSNGVYRPGAIGIDMPTLLVGNRSDRVARAQELSGRASSVVDKTRNLIALETEDAFFKWQAAADHVQLLRESAAKSAKLADLISARFDTGKVSGEDYLRARTLEDQTQAQLNEALYTHALALAALERVTSGGYTPSFRRPAPR